MWRTSPAIVLSQMKPNRFSIVTQFNPMIREHDVVDGEDRWAAVGVIGSLRVLVLIFAVRGDRIRVITGWQADRRTQKEYFSGRGT
jgi:uncharacterized DUF497 family protein